MGQVLKIGIPIAAQDGFIQIAFIIITIIANRRGLSAAAAVGIVEKIISFLFLLPSSMLSTVSALGAQNMGAGKYDRADQILRCAMGNRSGIWSMCGSFDSVYCGTCSGTVHDRYDGCYSRCTVYSWLYLGLHLCRCAF